MYFSMRIPNFVLRNLLLQGNSLIFKQFTDWPFLPIGRNLRISRKISPNREKFTQKAWIWKSLMVNFLEWSVNLQRDTLFTWFHYETASICTLRESILLISHSNLLIGRYSPDRGEIFSWSGEIPRLGEKCPIGILPVLTQAKTF